MSAFPITAFVEGMNAGALDLEKTRITDCPYWHETMAAKQWWEGYHRAQREAEEATRLKKIAGTN